MELAIIAGIGLLGYRFAAGGTTRAVTSSVGTVVRGDTAAYPFGPDTDVETLLAEDMDAARKHVMRVYNPATGKYTYETERVGSGDLPPPQPFLRSDKAAAAADSQRRVELFTGNEDTWKHKRERQPVFRPAETKSAVIGSGGTSKVAAPTYDPQELVDRNVFSSRMNNVLPFEQTRVGPGLGVGIDTPSADGLHPRFRVLPVEELNSHRINQLPGRSASGAALVTKSADTSGVLADPKRSLVENTPNVGAARAWNAPAWEPMPDNRDTRATGTSRSYHGTAASAVSQRYAAPKSSGVLAKELPAEGVVGGAVVHAAPPAGDTQYVFKRLGSRESRVPGVVPTGIFTAGTPRPECVSDAGLRETRARNAGRSSTLKKPGAVPAYVLGRGRETQGRTEMGSIPTTRADAGASSSRVSAANAYVARGEGGAGLATAQQRAAPGAAGTGRKLPSADPRWT